MSTRRWAVWMGIGLVTLLAVWGCALVEGQVGSKIEQAPALYAGKKVLWVDSYHVGNPWNEGIGRGIQRVLEDTGVELRIFRMDTARNTSETFKLQAALRAKAVIEEFEPDVLIASDDNAQKYLVVPYIKGSDLPVVFCGVNWDAAVYGYPAENVTGMIEVDLVEPLVRALREHARGDRIAYLSGETETQRKVTDNYNRRFFDGEMEVSLVGTFQAFKREFLRLQDETDMLITGNYVGIEGWDESVAQAFILQNTRIPTGYVDGYMTPFVLVTMGKVPEEQGEYAARTALALLEGAQPVDFPIVTNKRAVLGLNLALAERLGIVFSPSLLRNAEIIIDPSPSGP